MKIRTRLTLYFTILVMTLIVTRSSITYFSVYSFNQKSFYNRLYEKAHTTAELLLSTNNIDSALLKTIDRTQYDILPNEDITVYDSTYRQIYSSNDTISFSTAPEYFESIEKEKYIRFSEGPYKILGIYYSHPSRNVIITAGAIDTNGDALLHQVRLTLLGTLIFSIIINLIIGWYFVGKALEPITAIMRKVTTLSPVEKSERLPVITEKDEIADLIATFNKLFDKLEESFIMQKSFASNASHELFNPLTKMKSQLQVSLQQDRDKESYRQTIQSVLEDLNDLIVLTQNLLDFSKLQGNSEVAKENFRLDELLFDVRDKVRFLHPDYNIRINFNNPPEMEDELTILGNKFLIENAILNIVENACKFSPDKTADVHLVINGKEISISIADKGPGIAKKEIPFIYEPFYRSPAMTSAKGFGIGLALASRIFKAHRFPLQVESTLGSGTTFTILFKEGAV